MQDDDRDPRHYHDIAVTVCDTESGRFATDGRHGTWEWTEGNWSCDCNRDLLFDGDLRDPMPKCGTRRYVVVSAELLPGYDLSEFNDGYPAERVAKAKSLWAERMAAV